jgi:hypothetical protein
MQITRSEREPMGGNFGDVWYGPDGAYVQSARVEKCGNPCEHCRPRVRSYWRRATDEEINLHIETFIG